MKKYYALTLQPCRPDFARTMSHAEKAIMQEHVAYWKNQMDKGTVLVFGPVLDPEKTYGLGIVAVDDESEVVNLIAHDPASRINSYTYHPMMAIVPERLAG